MSSLNFREPPRLQQPRPCCAFSIRVWKVVLLNYRSLFTCKIVSFLFHGSIPANTRKSRVHQNTILDIEFHAHQYCGMPHLGKLQNIPLLEHLTSSLQCIRWNISTLIWFYFMWLYLEAKVGTGQNLIHESTWFPSTTDVILGRKQSWISFTLQLPLFYYWLCIAYRHDLLSLRQRQIV